MESELIFEGDLGAVFTTDADGGNAGNEASDVAMTEIPMDMDMEETDDNDTQELITGEGLDNQVNFPLLSVPQPIIVEEMSLEDQLRSTERLDRSSPDLWPQNLPTAAQQIMAKNVLKTGVPDNQGIWAQGLDPEDINLLHQFGSLTSSSLVEEVKKLQNIAYQLGLDEAKEMTRGKLLHALNEETVSSKERRHIKRLWN